MLAGLYGILLSRKPERVISHWMQHIEAAQTLVTAINVTGYIPERMSHMKSGTGRIWEHVQHIIFRLGIINICLESLIGSPKGLPFFFNFLKIIFHRYMNVLFNLQK